LVCFFADLFTVVFSIQYSTFARVFGGYARGCFGRVCSGYVEGILRYVREVLRRYGRRFRKNAPHIGPKKRIYKDNKDFAHVCSVNCRVL
jgi:hypothetical protein